MTNRHKEASHTTVSTDDVDKGGIFLVSLRRVAGSEWVRMGFLRGKASVVAPLAAARLRAKKLRR
jgi:hypothetical protein